MSTHFSASPGRRGPPIRPSDSQRHTTVRGATHHRAAEVGFDSSQPSIIPFNFTLLSHKGIHSQTDTPELYDISPDQLSGLHAECAEYIDNLETSVRDVFAETNRKLYRRMKDTSSIPLTFLYVRCMQHSLKLSGDSDPSRERMILHNLSTLLDA